MDFKSILNTELLKTSNEEGTRFVTMPQIGISGVPQVRGDIVGHAMRLVDNHTHFKNNCTRNSQNCTRLRFMLLLVQLFLNCTQMCMITYTNYILTLF